ncbi:MAG: BON domain-containing protein [Enhydrobacter sp.]|nr:BON domain-containing protein [Enhydrobacter sp.]
MNARDENIRNEVNDALTAAGVDVRNLAIESVDGRLIVKGTVPSADERERLARFLKSPPDGANTVVCDVELLPVYPSDTSNGRGRSPITGTSADSAHESRHQLDRS